MKLYPCIIRYPHHNCTRLVVNGWNMSDQSDMSQKVELVGIHGRKCWVHLWGGSFTPYPYIYRVLRTLENLEISWDEKIDLENLGFFSFSYIHFFIYCIFSCDTADMNNFVIYGIFVSLFPKNFACRVLNQKILNSEKSINVIKSPVIFRKYDLENLGFFFSKVLSTLLVYIMINNSDFWKSPNNWEYFETIKYVKYCAAWGPLWAKIISCVFKRCSNFSWNFCA